jgi:hypothetical protein
MNPVWYRGATQKGLAGLGGGQRGGAGEEEACNEAGPGRTGQGKHAGPARDTTPAGPAAAPRRGPEGPAAPRRAGARTRRCRGTWGRAAGRRRRGRRASPRRRKTSRRRRSPTRHWWSAARLRGAGGGSAAEPAQCPSRRGRGRPQTRTPAWAERPRAQRARTRHGGKGHRLYCEAGGLRAPRRWHTRWRGQAARRGLDHQRQQSGRGSLRNPCRGAIAPDPAGSLPPPRSPQPPRPTRTCAAAGTNARASRRAAAPASRSARCMAARDAICGTAGRNAGRGGTHFLIRRALPVERRDRPQPGGVLFSERCRSDHAFLQVSTGRSGAAPGTGPAREPETPPPALWTAAGCKPRFPTAC